MGTLTCHYPEGMVDGTADLTWGRSGRLLGSRVGEGAVQSSQSGPITHTGTHPNLSAHR